MIRRGAHLRHMVGRARGAVRQRRDEIGMAEANARREIVKTRARSGRASTALWRCTS